MKPQPSYPTEIKIDIVDIPQSLIDFFGQRGHYLRIPRKGEEGIAVTYSSIMGNNPPRVPERCTSDYPTEECPFPKVEPNSNKDADRAAIKAIKFIFGPGNYGVAQRAYMINTSTTPIKVRASIDGKPSKKVIYAKRPDTNRLVGHAFYGIISGIPETRWFFNRCVFVEEGIPGNTLSRLDERLYLHDPTYKEGLVRAAVHSEFLGLFRDVERERNRIIDSALRTILFDFNYLFQPKSPDEPNHLLSHYLEIPGFFGKRELDIYRDEQHQVVKRVEQHHKDFSKLAHLFGQLKDITSKTLDERVRDTRGIPNFVEYLERALETYRLV
jgi:hypothetical protein